MTKTKSKHHQSENTFKASSFFQDLKYIFLKYKSNLFIVFNSQRTII